jgi:hypothetical protein
MKCGMRSSEFGVRSIQARDPVWSTGFRFAPMASHGSNHTTTVLRKKATAVEEFARPPLQTRRHVRSSGVRRQSGDSRRVFRLRFRRRFRSYGLRRIRRAGRQTGRRRLRRGRIWRRSSRCRRRHDGSPLRAARITIIAAGRLRWDDGARIAAAAERTAKQVTATARPSRLETTATSTPHSIVAAAAARVVVAATPATTRPGVTVVSGRVIPACVVTRVVRSPVVVSSRVGVFVAGASDWRSGSRPAVGRCRCSRTILSIPVCRLGVPRHCGADECTRIVISDAAESAHGIAHYLSRSTNGHSRRLRGGRSRRRDWSCGRRRTSRRRLRDGGCRHRAVGLDSINPCGTVAGARREIQVAARRRIVFSPNDRRGGQTDRCDGETESKWSFHGGGSSIDAIQNLPA